MQDASFLSPESTAAETAVADFISSRINFERIPSASYGLTDFKLDRMRSLLEELGNPQDRIPAVHIAGTKGKGSTAAMSASMLQAAGARVGLYTSPHVQHFSERMTVNGCQPTAAELCETLATLRPVVERLDARGDAMRPTFFELLTAMAWLHFRHRRADLVVLETGLGGRLDATNLCTPTVCVITSISRDHERLLGSSLGAIAREKAGIIKRGVPVISGVRTTEPRDVIREVAALQAAPLIELDDQVRWEQVSEEIPSDVLPHKTVVVTTPRRTHRPLRSPLPGVHQADNLALAVAAVDQLPESAWPVTDEAMAAGLAGMVWPLRVEIIRRKPCVIVDAAHNVASVAALIDTLAEVQVARRILVFSTAKDKDTAGMLALLAPAFDEVILTRFVDNPRAVSRTELEAIAREVVRVPWTWADNPRMAWQSALQKADDDDLICATGSFFLAAEFREAVRAAN